MASPIGRFSTRALSNELKKLGSEVVDMTPDGTPLTRNQILADLIWKQTLGWEEVTRDAEGNVKKVKHPPVAWCQQFMFVQTEGKAPIAAPDEHAGLKAADRVRDLAKQRINGLAKIAAGPPKLKPKGT